MIEKGSDSPPDYVIAGPLIVWGGARFSDGIEVVGFSGQEIERIAQHKGGLAITPNGEIEIFLPHQKDEIREKNPTDSILFGTSLAFIVPDHEHDLRSQAIRIASEQGYLKSSNESRGFLTISPEGQYKYYSYTINPKHTPFPHEQNVANSVLAMLVTAEPGTKICALEESFSEPVVWNEFRDYWAAYFKAWV